MKSSWQHAANESVDRHFEQMVSVRKNLHANPELSGKEHDTSLFLYQTLSNAGLDVRIGPEGRGLVADMRVTDQRHDIPAMALRADIDALPIHDQKQVPYSSQSDGGMHACGHDVHSAIVLGTMMTLADLQNSSCLPWPVKIRGIFQPSEETCEGAREMIEAGALDDARAILALHVDPTREVGRIGLRQGAMTANCDNLRVKITGSGGHAARPHEASDPIAAGAQFINSLYSIVPRRTDSQDAMVVTIGQIRGAETMNVIPERVDLAGTLRTLDTGVRERTMEHVREMAEGIGKISGTEVEVHLELGAGAVCNDRNLIEVIQTAASQLIGVDSIEQIDRPSMGSEDFAFYLDHVPGAMFRLGSSSANIGRAPLHSPAFNVDHEALRIGARILIHSAVLWSNPCSHQSSKSATCTGKS